jgi:hypothetical protein
MCLSKPKIPAPVAAPAPIQPIESPIAEEKASTVETAVDTQETIAKKAKKSGTTALQTSSGLNIPTVSGLNIT